MIKFSIITVCLNAGQDLIDTVENTLNQSYDNFEIIVKDGFSKDGSIEKLPHNDKIKLFQKKDSGIYDAMNQAIEEATGDYLIFMNAGDRFYEKSTLDKVSNEIQQKRGDLYYGHCYNQRFNTVDTVPPKLTEYFCYRSMICHQATVYSASMLKQRGYDISYKVSADRERMLFAVLNEKKICIYIPVVIANFKSEGFCTTEKAKHLLKEEDARLKENYFSVRKQRIYSLKHKISMPGLRKKITANPTLYRFYKRLIGNLYGTRLQK